MFCTFDGNLKLMKDSLNKKLYFSSGAKNEVVPKFVLGASNRSTSGCLCCRRRRKKCDETYPICGSCEKRKVECVWGNRRSKVTSKDVIHDEMGETSLPKNMELQGFNTVMKLRKEHNIKRRSKSKWNQEAIESVDCQNIEFNEFNEFNEPSKQEPMKGPIYLHSGEKCADFIEPKFLLEPLSFTTLVLDDKGLMYFENFIYCVAPTIGVCPKSSNYFLKTFVKLAYSNEIILWALCSWGGIFIDGYNQQSLSYMKKAARLMTLTYKSLSNIKMEEVSVLLSFFLIAIGMEICAGDTQNWFSIFKQCRNMVLHAGGLRRICMEHSYSNDIKFLISNIMIHDALSTEAFSQGLLFDSKTYTQLFEQEKILDDINYGIDPLQGCSQPVYSILIAIQEESAHLKQMSQELSTLVEKNQCRENGDVDEADSSCTGFRCEYQNLKIKYLIEVERTYNAMNERIQNCLPNKASLTLLCENKEEIKLHVMLFETYINVCKLCLNMHIRGLPPSAPEQQLILSMTLSHIDVLRKTKFVASLSLSLLLCGIISSTEHERREMRTRIEDVLKVYHVANLRRMLIIVEEYWRRNPKGEISLDWIEICEEKGWNLPAV